MRQEVEITYEVGEGIVPLDQPFIVGLFEGLNVLGN